MYCSSCGKGIPDDSDFCPECGSRTRINTGDTVTRTPVQSTPVPSAMNIAIIVASLIVPFIGMIMGGIYMIDAEPAKKAAGKVWLFVGLGAFVFWMLVTLGY